MNKLLAVIALAVVGCGGGGGSTGKCSSSGTLTKQCSDCRETMCNNENIACLGPDYKNGNYTGPCAALVTCTCACASGDIACLDGCGSKDNTDCDNCNTAVLTCDQKCADKCGGMSVADMSMMTTGNCAALSACCSQLPSNEQAGCNSAATMETDSQCASALAGFQGAGQCH